MSNHAYVNPYRDDRPNDVSAEVVGEVLRAIGDTFVRTDAEQAAVERYRQLEREQRLIGARVDLRLADNGDLLRAARELGYKPTSMPPMAGAVELIGPGGATLLMRQSHDQMELLTSRRDAIAAVVRRCTLERAQRHLARTPGGKLHSKQLANGEVELRVVDGADSAAPAVVTARIAVDGRIETDISCDGGRCDALLDGLANAIGGRIRNKTLKPQYYAPVQPGEPTRIKSGS